jgi:hypothetical protein
MAKKIKGYKVSYTQILHNGKIRRDETVIIYKSKARAQDYADQLNRGRSYKNARVKKVT